MVLMSLRCCNNIEELSNDRFNANVLIQTSELLVHDIIFPSKGLDRFDLKIKTNSIKIFKKIEDIYGLKIFN